MRDIATVAGVSVQTVSNVVNGRSQHTTEATRSRIEAIIADLGYRPNSVARGLRSARTQTLALLVVDASARFLADPMKDLFLAGLADEMRERSYGLLIRATAPGAPLESLAEPLAEGRADGAVLLLSGTPRQRGRYIRGLRSLGRPLILLQEHRARRSGVPTLCAEDRQGGRAICRHLLSRGHRRIGFLTANERWSAIEERIHGYREAHAEAGVRVDESLILHSGAFDPLDAAAAAGAFLDGRDRPTAMMCGNDLMALGIQRAARDRGLRVPDDVAVAGFDDFDFAAAVEPPLTTVRIPGYEMGRFAASSMIDALASGGTPQSRVFPIDVVLRESA